MHDSHWTDLKYSFIDGVFAHIFATLTGGLFLTGFALFLGMNELMIGMLAAIPFLATIFQFPTCYFLERRGSRKRFTGRAALIARTLWMPILIIALLPGNGYGVKGWIILGLIFASHAAISVSYVSWLSWISDLVPAGIRGRFFGSRNMLCGAAGMTGMLVFGNLLDHLRHNGDPAIGFSIVLTAAVLSGLISLLFQRRISEPACRISPEPLIPFAKGILLPFKRKNFRRFILFSFFWNFSVYFASPFFTLYFLRNLHFSYSFVALLGTVSALADLLGMQVWGRIADRVKNKAVIRLAMGFVVFLPLAWSVIGPDSLVLPILFHFLGGGFWAGITLCTNNLLFGLAPAQNKSFYLSGYNLAAGLGAAISPVAAGLILKLIDGMPFQIGAIPILPLQMIFITSSVLRLVSSQLILAVREPEEASPVQVIRILKNVRVLNIASGFNQLLHPFVEISKEAQCEKHR